MTKAGDTKPSIHPCPACGGTVSAAAPSCPHCGHPLIEPTSPPGTQVGTDTKSKKHSGQGKKPGFWRTTISAIGSLVIIWYMVDRIQGTPEEVETTTSSSNGGGATATAPEKSAPTAGGKNSKRKVGTKTQIGCVSKDAYDEVSTAAMNQDRRQFNLLFTDRKCFLLDGLEFSVVKTDWGKAKIRVYTSDGSVVLWTNIETTM